MIRVLVFCISARAAGIKSCSHNDFPTGLPLAARKVLEIVSSQDKEFCVVPGGHAGVFAGSKAPENTWSISADWLEGRSK